MTNERESIKQIKIDVLIVGGGVQGLWLLNDLVKVGYKVILIEKNQIGGEQTLHSHGFLHRGYGYTNPEMAQRLKAVTERWNSFIRDRSISVPPAPSLYGFTSLANSLLWRGQWAETGLEAKDYQKLSFMEKGLLRRVFETNEKWLNTAELVRCLATSESTRQSIFHGQIERIKYSPDKDRIEMVEVVINDEHFFLSPELIVFAAGAGNHQLLRMVNNAYVQNKALKMQQLRKSLMLVIKGNGFLMDLALVVPDLWLFIVSRRNSEEDNIWLVSYDVDTEYDERQSIDPDPSRVQDTTTALFAILPQLFSRKNVRKMEWGCYTGLKAEARKTESTAKVETGQVLIPQEWSIEPFAGNLYVVWPTKLTLAPEASQALMFRLLDNLHPPLEKFIPQDHGLPNVNLEFGKEKWEVTALLPWEEFKIKYNIKHRGDE